ncbi:hypothetical protein GCM10011371_33170 [Novosphingobium marinum]|uniref:Uncharacterized protein n=1 Tax=Novosphingobium marinum TaxID=1514948 RepID=A0A7Y9Y141_9SPHN|nr:hypothetical protein [Novosphingobium marinum]NYH97043.1 hypothetical protein [Novosphingobium marinum]GGC43098.1 hypothetical protein GCM10011371_33170 [Novosphingobium marinum]
MSKLELPILASLAVIGGASGVFYAWTYAPQAQCQRAYAEPLERAEYELVPHRAAEAAEIYCRRKLNTARGTGK